MHLLEVLEGASGLSLDDVLIFFELGPVVLNQLLVLSLLWVQFLVLVDFKLLVFLQWLEHVSALPHPHSLNVQLRLITVDTVDTQTVLAALVSPVKEAVHQVVGQEQLLAFGWHLVVSQMPETEGVLVEVFPEEVEGVLLVGGVHVQGFEGEQVELGFGEGVDLSLFFLEFFDIIILFLLLFFLLFLFVFFLFVLLFVLLFVILFGFTFGDQSGEGLLGVLDLAEDSSELREDGVTLEVGGQVGQFLAFLLSEDELVEVRDVSDQSDVGEGQLVTDQVGLLDELAVDDLEELDELAEVVVEALEVIPEEGIREAEDGVGELAGVGEVGTDSVKPLVNKSLLPLQVHFH